MFITLFIFGLLVFGMLIFSWIHEDAQQSSSIPDRTDLQLQSKLDQIKKLIPIDSAAAAEEARIVVEQDLTAKQKRYLGFGFNAGILDMEFYGQVLDQFGMPVVGAKVYYEALGKFYGRGSGFGVESTNAEGKFSFQANGNYIRIDGIAHPDIIFSHRPPKAYGDLPVSPSMGSLRFYTGQPEVGGKEELWTETSPENPYVFKAWRVEKFGRVVHSYTGANLRVDGTPFFFGFDGRRLNQNVAEHSAILKFTCTRGEVTKPREYTDWEMKVEVIGGGLKRVEELYLNHAPDSGYVSSDGVKMKLGDTGFRHRSRARRYYFTFEGGKYYGSMMISFLPFSSEKLCGMDIDEYRINLDGEPYLAYKNP